MIFYFDRETGKRVTKSTWKRSKSHGGSRYVRRSVSPTPKEGTREQQTRPISADTLEPSTQGNYTPSEVPRTWQEFQKRQSEIEKRKRQRYDYNYDEGPEYETGVDY